jgi:hypothetical protein
MYNLYNQRWINKRLTMLQITKEKKRKKKLYKYFPENEKNKNKKKNKNLYVKKLPKAINSYKLTISSNLMQEE